MEIHLILHLMIHLVILNHFLLLMVLIHLVFKHSIQIENNQDFNLLKIHLVRVFLVFFLNFFFYKKGFQQHQFQQNNKQQQQQDFKHLLPNVNMNFEEDDDEFGSNQFSFEDFETASHMTKNVTNMSGNNDVSGSKLLSLLKKQPDTNQAKRSLFQQDSQPQHFQDPAILDYQFNGLY